MINFCFIITQKTWIQRYEILITYNHKIQKHNNIIYNQFAKSLCLMIFRNMLFVFQLIGKVLFYEVCFLIGKSIIYYFVTMKTTI